jgi:hypothetical protein
MKLRELAGVPARNEKKVEPKESKEDKPAARSEEKRAHR